MATNIDNLFEDNIEAVDIPDEMEGRAKAIMEHVPKDYRSLIVLNIIYYSIAEAYERGKVRGLKEAFNGKK